MSSIRRIVRDDLRRNRRHFVLSSVGVVVGIAAFSFFLALGTGVRDVVLGEIFPLDKLEVIPRVMDVDLGPLRMGLGGADALDEEAVNQLRGVEHVDEVYPKMKLTVPSIAKGGASILGNDLYTEMLVDGIEPALVTDEIDSDYHFDYTPPPEEPKACETDKDCPNQHWCGRAFKEDPQLCHPYVPVVASPHLVELYNGTLRRAHGFPKLNPDFVVGLTFDMFVGRSMVKGSRKEKVLHEKGLLVGFSDKAISIGATIPIDYVREFNATYLGEDSRSTYHSVIVQVDSKDSVAAVAKSVQELNFDVADSGAEQAAMLIAIFMAVFGLISVVIVGIAAVNIMHVFFMLVYERQKEFGIMRAVGANRADLRRIILSEAAVVGFVAGLLGLGLAYAGSPGFDHLSATYIPDFPYKPDTYFHFHPSILGGALGFAVGFCVLGAALPASRAARLDPVVVLTQN